MIKRGQIWYVDMGSTYEGSIQGGKRPVVIVSNNKGNYYSPILLVVPITSSITKHELPTHVEIQLKVPSTVLCEQIFTINKDDLISYEGIATDKEIEEINKALAIAIGIKG